MRKAVARCVVAMGAGFALLVAQGCKKQAAPASVQPAVRSVARAQPDFPLGSLPVEDVDARVTPRIDRGLRQWPAPVLRVQVQPVQEQSADARAAAQREQDERLLEQQEAESRSQQEELNRDMEEYQRMQEKMQAEPRIQDNPGVPQPVQPQ